MGFHHPVYWIWFSPSSAQNPIFSPRCVKLDFRHSVRKIWFSSFSVRCKTRFSSLGAENSILLPKNSFFPLFCTEKYPAPLDWKTATQLELNSALCWNNFFFQSSCVTCGFGDLNFWKSFSQISERSFKIILGNFKESFKENVRTEKYFCENFAGMFTILGRLRMTFEKVLWKPSKFWRKFMKNLEKPLNNVRKKLGNFGECFEKIFCRNVQNFWENLNKLCVSKMWSHSE